jgi:formate C-acetyltransferase
MAKGKGATVLSERIERLRETILDLPSISAIIPRQTVQYQPDPRKSPVLRQAEAVKALFEGVSVNHLPGEMIVGNNTTKYSPRPNHLTEEEIECIRGYPNRVPEKVLAAMEEQLFYLWPFSQGHIIPDKELVLKRGMTGIIADIEAVVSGSGFSEYQRRFFQACLIECRAFLVYVKRHVDYFRARAAGTSGVGERDYFLDLAALCSRVPAHPASSFREALQTVWFAQIATQFDDCSNHSLGRLDQYLYPYYRDDIDRRVISRDDARELFFEFWLKFNLGYRLQEMSGTKMGFRSSDPESREVAQGIRGEFNRFDVRDGYSWLVLKVISADNHTDDGQTMDIAGLDIHGSDATNELSWLVLEAEDELRTFEPKAVVKYTEKTDPLFMKKACDVLASGLGLPGITFHEAGARALRRYGIFAEEDILNHSHIGCVELGFPGKSYTDPMNGFINLPKILLISMNGGYLNGRELGLKLEEPTCWNEFADNYHRQLDYFVKLYADTMNHAAPFYAAHFFRPLVSALVDGCIRRGVPVDSGGATYHTRSINCTGFATAVDSLFTVKKLVYDEGEMELRKLREILNNDFADMEDLRLRIRNRLPKYGNGDREVDLLAGELAASFSDIVKECRLPGGGRFRPGIYSFYEPIKAMGRVTGATPDGRRSGDLLSLNSSPSHGAIRRGLTDVLRSVTAIDHTKVDNASCIDVKLGSGVKPEIISYIVDYLSEKDVLYVQFTVADRERLLDARKHPEQHQDLIVRVTGFSARYVVLPQDTQDEILERSYWNGS